MCGLCRSSIEQSFIKQVSKHKISDNRIEIECDTEEVCYICGRRSYVYPTSRANGEPSFHITLNEDYFLDYNTDIEYNGYIYHTCSQECKELFTITLATI